MKSNIAALSFIIGAAAGSIVTWYSVKKKYERLAQEEIDSVKKVFANRKVKSEEKDISAMTEEDKSVYNNIIAEEGYVTYSDRDATKKEANMKRNRPYVIPPEQFGEEDEYDTISLTFYADQILTDDNDEIIEDVEETVGFESLSHFGEYEDDSVFVRNDARKCDYEILLDERMYSEVIKHRPY